MMLDKIITLDLNFMGIPGAIACYLLPHRHGGVLVECGPGSTIPALISGLRTHGLNVNDITDVFVTHIHLDHAGAAGWLARQGARIHIHPNGAAHMLNPEKLLSSAARIYGDQMDILWGEFLPVPADRLSVVQDCEEVEIAQLRLRALDTPGHADHHYIYLFEDVCFSGDIGGVRLADTQHVRLPMPPPEFHIEKWRLSLQRMQNERFKAIAPTHFGVFEDPEWHMAALADALNDVEDWIESRMPYDPDVSEINQELSSRAARKAISDGVPADQLSAYESANPTWMSGYGIQRYWRKYRQEQKG